MTSSLWSSSVALIVASEEDPQEQQENELFRSYFG
jgi:hypothetical protein